MSRPPMTPQPDAPMPDERGPVPPMRNPGNPPRPQQPETVVPDPDDPTDNDESGIERAPKQEPFPDDTPEP